MIAVTLRSGDPTTSLLSPISQELVTRELSPNPNDLADLPSKTGGLTYPDPSQSSAVISGSSDWAEESDIKYLCTITRDGWSPLQERQVAVK